MNGFGIHEAILFSVAVIAVYIVLTLIKLTRIGRHSRPIRRRNFKQDTPVRHPASKAMRTKQEPSLEQQQSDKQVAGKDGNPRRGQPITAVAAPPISKSVADKARAAYTAESRTSLEPQSESSFEWDELDEIFGENADSKPSQQSRQRPVAASQVVDRLDTSAVEAAAEEIDFAADDGAAKAAGDYRRGRAEPYFSQPPLADEQAEMAEPPMPAARDNKADLQQQRPAAEAEKRPPRQRGFGEPLSEHLIRSDLETEVQRMRDEMESMRVEVEQLRAARRVSSHYAEAMELAQAGLTAQEVADRLGISLAEAELVHALSRGEQNFEEGEQYGEDADWDNGNDRLGRRGAG